MKKKIILIAACAILVIGGCGAGVAVIRNRNMAKAPETPTEVNATYEESNDVPADFTMPSTENSTTQEQTTEGGLIDNLFKNVKKTTVAAVRTTRRTVATTKKAANNTTKKAAKTTRANESVSGIVKDAIGDNAQQSFLGYRYSSDGYYYCDDKDCWQKDVGYNEVYDKWAPVAAMYIDQIRIRFQYGGKNWMVQLWKGQYGYLLIGAEIGLYTCDLNAYKGETGDINHFHSADKSDWLKMQLDCYFCKGGKGTYKKLFTRPYDTYWWATGFVKGQLTKYTNPRTELKTRNRVTFKSEDQANLFVQGLKQSGFVRAASADKLVNDSYYMNGKDVWVLWYSKHHDCFVGYEHNSTTAKVSTTAAPSTTAPTTAAPTTTAPTTAPTTLAPSTEAPSTEAPAPTGNQQETPNAAN